MDLNVYSSLRIGTKRWVPMGSIEKMYFTIFAESKSKFASVWSIFMPCAVFPILCEVRDRGCDSVSGN